MAALVCDICGGKLVMQSGGVAKCDSCGMEYTKECIQEKVQEIKGTVKIDGPVETVKGDAEKERLIKTAQECFRKGAVDEADKMFRKISKDYPNEWRAWMGIIYSESLSLTNDEIRNLFIFQYGQEKQTPDQFLESEYKKALAFAPENEKSNIEMYRKDFVIALQNRIEKILLEDKINNLIDENSKLKSKIEESEISLSQQIDRRQSEVGFAIFWFVVFVVVVIAFIMIPQLSAWWLLLIIPTLGVLTLSFIMQAFTSGTADNNNKLGKHIENMKSTFYKNKSEIEKLQNQIKLTGGTIYENSRYN